MRNDEDFELAQSSEFTTWENIDMTDDTFAENSDLTEISDDELGSMLTMSLEA